jgi:hypothetical protein
MVLGHLASLVGAAWSVRLISLAFSSGRARYTIAVAIIAIVVPPGAEETEQDKLCPACRELPPAPQGTDDQPA